MLDEDLVIFFCFFWEKKGNVGIFFSNQLRLDLFYCILIMWDSETGINIW